jgi:pilus assembly protein CpaB
MRRRLVTVILFAVVAALAASTALYKVISARTETPKVATVHVLVATRDLNIGALIQDSDVREVEWPGAVAPHWVSQRPLIVGRGVIANINKGEPISENRLAPKGAGAGLAAVIPGGMRAVAVKVDEVVGVSGFVLPGMRVDVLSSGTPPGASGTVTRTILQNIEVLSAGQNIERDMQGKAATVQVVNLLVAPDQAEALSLAGAQTKIQLVLRNPLDTQTVKTAGISTAQLLLGAPAPAPNPARAERPRPVKAVAPAPVVPAPAKVEPVRETIEVIRGEKREFVAIGTDGMPEVRQ